MAHGVFGLHWLLLKTPNSIRICCARSCTVQRIYNKSSQWSLNVCTLVLAMSLSRVDRAQSSAVVSLKSSSSSSSSRTEWRLDSPRLARSAAVTHGSWHCPMNWSPRGMWWRLSPSSLTHIRWLSQLHTHMYTPCVLQCMNVAGVKVHSRQMQCLRRRVRVVHAMRRRTFTVQRAVHSYSWHSLQTEGSKSSSSSFEFEFELARSFLILRESKTSSCLIRCSFASHLHKLFTRLFAHSEFQNRRVRVRANSIELARNSNSTWFETPSN